MDMYLVGRIMAAEELPLILGPCDYVNLPWKGDFIGVITGHGVLTPLIEHSMSAFNMLLKNQFPQTKVFKFKKGHIAYI